MSDLFKGWKQKKPVENTKQNKQKTVNHVKILVLSVMESILGGASYAAKKYNR